MTGHDLPLSRVVSRTMHPDEGYHDHAGTVMVIAWGQFMDHDYTLTATPLGMYFAFYPGDSLEHDGRRLRYAIDLEESHDRRTVASHTLARLKSE